MKIVKSKKKKTLAVKKIDSPIELAVNPVSGSNDPLEKHLRAYFEDYLKTNQSARIVAAGLRVIGLGLRPVIDHLAFRALDADKRAKEFLDWGYDLDRNLGVIEFDTWWAKVYRKPGYPTIFIDQAFSGRRGMKSLIPDWVKEFGDHDLHHVAIQVDDIEQAVFYLEKQGVRFSGQIVGDHGADLRQIFTLPEVVHGKPFSVLELTERHRGYTGFIPPQANGLMESTRLQ